MDTRKILTELRGERDRIDRAIAALEAISQNGVKTARAVARPVAGRTTKRRRISAAGRKRLSQMMKQRWAAQKKAGKSKLG